VAIIAVGIALVVVLVAASAVLLVAADDGESEPGAPGAPSGRDTEPVPSGPSEPANEPDGPPAKVELRRVLQVLGRAVDCRDPGLWCSENGGLGSFRLGPVELRTEDIVSADARVSEYGDYVVGVTLSEAGAETFEQVTTELAENTGVRAQLAIVVDERVVSAPEVQGPIPGGEIDIAADFTQAEAERLAAAVDP
jgi:preprotein translocase subunit SecD